MLQRMKEDIVTELFPEHLQHQACLAVDISRVLKRVAKIVRHYGNLEQAPLPQPRRLRAPARVRSIVGAVLMFLPNGGHKRRESLVEPYVAPILAGHQIAEPL